MQIDWWTLALQAINFLVLVWLLSRFLYRPVVDIVARRREAAQKLLTDAQAERTQIQAERAEIAQIRAGFAAERHKALEDARNQAEEAAKAAIADAKTEAEKLLSEARAAAARTEAASGRAVAHEAGQLALVIAEKLLSRLHPQNSADAFLDGLCEKLRSLPPNAKAALQNGGTIEVATANPLSPDGQERMRHVLTDCIASKSAFTFHTEPTLIAGLELKSRDIVVHNNWREDLRTIGEALQRQEAERDAAT